MRRLLSLLSLCVATMVCSASATSFLELPFPDSVKDAPVIVRGKVGSNYADWSKDAVGGRQLYTFYELQVDEALKGGAGVGSILIRELGGEKDGVGMQVAGVSQYERGEDVVVFLGNRNSDGSYDVRGMMMGKFNVMRDEKGREFLVGAGINSLTHPAIRGHEQHIHPEEGHRDTRSDSKWTMEALRRLIKSQATEDAALNPQRSQRVQSPANPRADAQEMRDQAAPQLQTSVSEVSHGAVDGSRTSWSRYLPWFALLLGVVGISIILMTVLLRGRGRS